VDQWWLGQEDAARSEIKADQRFSPRLKWTSSELWSASPSASRSAGHQRISISFSDQYG